MKINNLLERAKKHRFSVSEHQRLMPIIEALAEIVKVQGKMLDTAHTYVRDINELKPENFFPPNTREECFDFCRIVAGDCKGDIEEARAKVQSILDGVMK